MTETDSGLTDENKTPQRDETHFNKAALERKRRRARKNRDVWQYRKS